MEHITNPFVFNDVVSWLWKRLFCGRGIHLFDEILTEDPEQSYFECDGCGYQVSIVRRTNVTPQADRLSALEAWVTKLEGLEERVKALESNKPPHAQGAGSSTGGLP